MLLLQWLALSPSWFSVHGKKTDMLVEDRHASANITKQRAIMELLKKMSSHNHNPEIGYGPLEPTRFLNTVNIPDWAFAEQTLYQKIRTVINC